MQLKCTWSSISPSLWYRCKRIVVPGLPASHMLYNRYTNGEYGGRRISSKPEFWMAASAWADLWSDALSWLQVTSVFSWTERIHEKTQNFLTMRTLSPRHMAGWNTKNNNFFYNGIRALEKCWTKHISVASVYVEKWQNMMYVSRR